MRCTVSKILKKSVRVRNLVEKVLLWLWWLLVLLFLLTSFFFLVFLLLYQRWSPPLRLQLSDCNILRIKYDIPSIAVFCSKYVVFFLVCLPDLYWSFCYYFDQWHTEGGGCLRCSKPLPPQIPKALQSRAKLNPICENC